MEETAYHSLYAREMTHWFCTTRREVIAQILGRAHAENRVLEIGSGTGGNVRMLRAYGALTCIEPSSLGRKLTEIREGPGIDLRGGLWPQEDPLDSGEKFDLIALLDVLEHIDADVASLAAAREHLAPGGRVVITVPSYQWMWSAHDTSLHHVRRYTRRSITSAVREAGLRPIRVTYFNTLLFPAAALARGVFTLLRLERSPGRAVPGPAVNSLLRTIFRIELPLLKHTNLPFGLSLIVVASADPR